MILRTSSTICFLLALVAWSPQARAQAVDPSGPQSIADLPPPAPQRFALHVEGAPLFDFRKFGGIAAFDVELEITGCCSLGAYADYTGLTGSRQDDTRDIVDDPGEDRVTAITDGGLQVAFAIPGLEKYLRLRGRVGKAGTPPQSPWLGRGGVSTSAALLMRFWDTKVLHPDEFQGNIDVLVGFVHWEFGREKTAAGPVGDESSQNAVMLGLRLGVDYGVDFN